MSQELQSERHTVHASGRLQRAEPTPEPRSHSISLPSLPLENGHVLRDAHLSYQVDGADSTPRDNVVLVLHALTGSARTAVDWWRAVRQPGWTVVAPDLSSAFAGADGSDGAVTPAVTTRDMARVLGVLLERLRIPRVACVLGGSLGGMVALEFIATFPGRAARAVVFAAPAAQGAAAIGWVHVQREALRAAKDSADGLALARQIAMLTYRSAAGLQQRFGRRADGGSPGTFAVQSWLRAHGERLTARFDAARYLALLDAMDAHDVGRGRGGVGERLRASGTALTGVGIACDLFYPASDVAAWAAESGATYREIDSVHGHDAFLIEHAQVAAIIADTLGAA